MKLPERIAAPLSAVLGQIAIIFLIFIAVTLYFYLIEGWPASGMFFLGLALSFFCRRLTGKKDARIGLLMSFFISNLSKAILFVSIGAGLVALLQFIWKEQNQSWTYGDIAAWEMSIFESKEYIDVALSSPYFMAGLFLSLVLALTLPVTHALKHYVFAKNILSMISLIFLGISSFSLFCYDSISNRNQELLEDFQVRYINAQKRQLESRRVVYSAAFLAYKAHSMTSEEIHTLTHLLSAVPRTSSWQFNRALRQAIVGTLPEMALDLQPGEVLIVEDFKPLQETKIPKVVKSTSEEELIAKRMKDTSIAATEALQNLFGQILPDVPSPLIKQFVSNIVDSLADRIVNLAVPKTVNTFELIKAWLDTRLSNKSKNRLANWDWTSKTLFGSEIHSPQDVESIISGAVANVEAQDSARRAALQESLDARPWYEKIKLPKIRL